MLVVGLGNPGPRYAESPHNVGFRVLESLATHLGESSWTQRFQGECLMALVDQQKLVLLKPMTYMNRSGYSVRQAMSFFKIGEGDTLVVHDELDLPLGAIKLKRGGGEAGHNGLRSISEQLGSRDYARLRVGVGRPAAGDVTDFLLSPMSKDERERLGVSIEVARAAIELVAREGLERAMNLVNRQPADPPPTAPGRPN